ncbi:SAM-dependent methyltransferase, partial [Klebsiella pneumoniae]
MYYLLHCLPGAMVDKGVVIKNVKAALTKDGILYGATILGDGVKHNSFSSKLMRIYNHKGIFSNMSDSEEGLKKILSEHFEYTEISVKGTVAMFLASMAK